MDNSFYTEVYSIDKGDILKNIFLPKGKLNTQDIVVKDIFSIPNEFAIVDEDETLKIWDDYNTVYIEVAEDSLSVYNYDFLIQYYDGNKLPRILVDCGENIELGFEFVNESDSKVLFARYERTLCRQGVFLSFKGIISSKEITQRLTSDTNEEDIISSNKLSLICRDHKIADYI